LGHHMDMKKLTIIGRGTAGCLALAHFSKFTNWEIDFTYDPDIPQQAVGEGSQIPTPVELYNTLDFTHQHLSYVDGSFKGGLIKDNWGDTKQKFNHDFYPPNVGYHFNAVKLQDYIISKLKNNSKVKIIESNISHNDIDSDFILDCSGKPEVYDDCYMSESIPVNSVYVTQCFWDFSRFQHTLTIARPYGWVFGIPLQNRCSIGYMYNNTINTLEEVKEDVKHIFDEYNLTPSNATNAFNFKNYYRKENYSKRIIYNGNASFFLEPLEATSTSVMITINKNAVNLWSGKTTDVEFINLRHVKFMKEIETMIALHYFSGSIFKTPFWDMAKEKGYHTIKNSLKNPRFLHMIELSKKFDPLNNDDFNFGTWGVGSFRDNLINLNLYKKLDELYKI